jgi:hypothetical protein
VRRARDSAAALAAAALLGAALTGGCAGGGGARGARPALEDACVRVPGDAGSDGSFTFALRSGFDPRAPFRPVPRSDGEAIVLALAYETLLDLDCEGRLVPALAEKFELSEELDAWRFELRRDVAFSSGEPLDAGAVERALSRSRRNAAALLEPGRNFWFWRGIRGRAIRAAGGAVLLVETPEEPELPLLLALPAFAIVHPDAGGRWPPGTRGTLEGPRTRGGETTLVWRRESRDVAGGGSGASAGARAAAPGSITFRIEEDADPRDLVTAGVDAFFVRDREAVRYLERVEGFRVTPFPWSRLYVLLVPDARLARSLPLDLEDLARSSTIAPARPAAPLALSLDGERRDAAAETPGRARIVFPDGDADARALAARIASLATRGGTAAPVAAGLAWPGEFLSAVTGGAETAYVLPVFPRLPGEGMLRTELLRCAPWLERGGEAIALVETRGHLVSREGLCGIYAGFDGLPRLDRAGWDRGRILP